MLVAACYLFGTYIESHQIIRGVCSSTPPENDQTSVNVNRQNDISSATKTNADGLEQTHETNNPLPLLLLYLWDAIYEWILMVLGLY